MTLAMLIDEGLPRLRNPTNIVSSYWRATLGSLRLGKITPELVALHRDHLLGADCRGYRHRSSKPRSPAAVRNCIVELSRLFSLAIKKLRGMEANPCNNVKEPPASYDVPQGIDASAQTPLTNGFLEAFDGPHQVGKRRARIFHGLPRSGSLSSRSRASLTSA